MATNSSKREGSGKTPKEVTRKLSLSFPLPETPVGRIDRYALLSKLGAGGFGAVYRARDEVADMEAAVKALPPLVAHNPDELAKVQENFKLVAKLRHPNIANVIHLHEVAEADSVAQQVLGVEPGDRLIVMDYIRGATLTGWRREFPGDRVPLEAALPVLAQIAEALDYAHSQRIIHRDIKPANVIVGEDGHVTVLDFGLAAEIRSSMSRVSHSTGDRAGTPAYMAPEQWAGRRQDAQVDQYGLAVLAYELLSGQVPFATAFEGTSILVMYHAVRTQKPARIRHLIRRRNRALLHALAKRPQERFSSCAEFIAALGGDSVRKRKVAVSPSRELEPGDPAGLPAAERTAVLDRTLGVLAILLAVIAFGVPTIYLQVQAIKENRQAENSTRAASGERQRQVRRLLREARDAFANGAHVLALRNVKRALQTDPASSAAQALRAEILLEVGLDVIVPMRSEAEIRLKKLQGYDREQGFGERLDAAVEVLASARFLSDAKEYELALEKYEQFIKTSQALEALETARQSARKEAVSATAAKETALAAGAGKEAKELLEGADQLVQSAGKAFAEGDFEGAAKMWVTACAQFAKAEYFAKGMQAVREKQGAYEKALAEADRELLATHGGEKWEEIHALIAAAERLAGEAKWYDAAAAWAGAAEKLPQALEEATENKRNAKDKGEQANPDALGQARVAEAIAAAEAAKAQADWEAVLRFANDALTADPDLDRAKALRAEAERALTPLVNVRCRAGDQDVVGAYVFLDGGLLEQRTPLTVELTRGEEHRIRVVLGAVSGGIRYAPFEAVYTPRQPGPQEVVASLVEAPLPDDLIGTPNGEPAAAANLAAGSEEALARQRRAGLYSALPLSVRSRRADLSLRLVPPGAPRRTDPADTPLEAAEDTPAEGASTQAPSAPFYVSMYEVTVAQWYAVMGGEPVEETEEKTAEMPMTGVSWIEAMEFCRTLCTFEGAEEGTYRLPTSEEWIYVCRAGTEGAYVTGETARDLAKAGWYQGNSGTRLHAVGGLLPNAWGLYDLHGNVWEWCRAPGAAADAALLVAGLLQGGEAALCLARGGSWSAPAEACRADSARSLPATYRGPDVGFRVIRTLPKILP